MNLPSRKQGMFSALLGKFGLEAKADTSGARAETPNVETKGALADPEPWLIELFAGDASPSLAGITVSPMTAMSCAPVRCAVQAITETIGQLPIQVYQRGADGSKERNQDHPAYVLLHDAANDWTPASTFREQITRDALLERHGGFAFINRVDGKPIELIRLDPFRSAVEIRYVNGEPTYEVTEGGNTRIIDRQNILHIPTPSHSPFGGLLHDAREAIGLALVMEQYANGYAFTLNLGPEEIAAANDNAKGFLDYFKRRIARALHRALGYQPDHLIAGGIAALDRPHLHGTIEIANDNDVGATKAAIERAGGEWAHPRGKEYQLDWQPLTTPDVWTNYILRNCASTRRRGVIAGRTVSITGSLRRRARALWDF